MIQVLPLPRQLPRAVIWSIYTVTWLGLIVAIVVVVLVYSGDDRKPLEPERKESPKELQSQRRNDTREDVPAKRLFIPHDIKRDNSSSKTRRQHKQHQQSRPRARSDYVTLEEVVAYECHFQAVYQNTTWLEGSDTEISYLDAFGRPRLMNVLLLDPLETSEQRRVMDSKLPWAASEAEVTRMLSGGDESSRHVAVLWNNCPETEECRLITWVLSSAITEDSSESAGHFSRPLVAQGRLGELSYAHEELTRSDSPNIYTTRTRRRYIWNSQRQLHRKHGISTRERCPSFSLARAAFTFVPRGSRRRDVDLQHHRANGLPSSSSSSSSSRRRRRDVAEWKELKPSHHVTKMILGGTTTYFVAAPISNVSLRFVYAGDGGGGGEAPRCLTCPEGGVSGGRLECLSSDAAFSRNARYYILYCRGPEVPWTAVVSTRHNELVYRLDNQERSRDWYASRPRPVTRELEVKLDDEDARRGARVRLHLPPDWRDGGDECNERSRLLLRIADEQRDQMVDARFDFSLTNYLTTVKGYAVVYADVRASLFQSFNFRHLRFRRRELMQMSDYAKVVAHVLTHFECVEDRVIGVYGENYGGHMVLNLLADNDEKRNSSGGDDKFRCGVAVNPMAKWQDYVYPFTAEHSTGVPGALRKKMFKRHYMARLVGRLRGKNFALHTTSHSSSPQHRYYTQTLLKMLNRHAVGFEHQHYEDESARMCDSRLKSYERASDFFDRCFGREIDDEY